MGNLARGQRISKKGRRSTIDSFALWSRGAKPTRVFFAPGPHHLGAPLIRALQSNILESSEDEHRRVY